MNKPQIVAAQPLEIDKAEFYFRVSQAGLDSFEDIQSSFFANTMQAIFTSLPLVVSTL